MTDPDLYADTLDRQIADALRITDDLLTRISEWIAVNKDAPIEQLVATLSAVSEAQERALLGMQLLGGRPTEIEERRQVCPACKADDHNA